ncbi:MAG: hypothetical protein LC096_02790 [Bacteroidia bacterium]|nr:hypothetical protein [Bacteroidia bacterium]
MAEYINLGVLVIFLYVVYYIIERLYPILRNTHSNEIPFEILSQKYKKLTNRFTLLGLLVIPILTVIIRFALYYLLVFRISFLNDNVIAILPPSYAQWILSGVLGFIVGVWFLSTIIYYKILTDWENYLYYIQKSIRIDVAFYSNYLGRIAVFVLLIVFYMMFDWFYVFGREEIKLNDFLGIGVHKYSYDMVKEIHEVKEYQTPFGNTISYPHYILYMNDGNKWNSIFEGHNNTELNAEIVNKLILPNSNKELITIEAE